MRGVRRRPLEVTHRSRSIALRTQAGGLMPASPSGPGAPPTDLSCCAPPWSTPWRPAPAPTRTGQPHRRPASCPRLPHRSPPYPPPDPDGHTDRPASSAEPSWPPSCPPAGAATAPAKSRTPPPATSTATTAVPPLEVDPDHRQGPPRRVIDARPGGRGRSRPDLLSAPCWPGPVPGPTWVAG
jgi:hypothetical protein